MKQAFIIASMKAIRTFCQADAGSLSAFAVVSIAQPELMALGNAVLIATLASALAALITFLQNFAEGLPE